MTSFKPCTVRFRSQAPPHYSRDRPNIQLLDYNAVATKDHGGQPPKIKTGDSYAKFLLTFQKESVQHTVELQIEHGLDDKQLTGRLRTQTQSKKVRTRVVGSM